MANVWEETKKKAKEQLQALRDDREKEKAAEAHKRASAKAEATEGKLKMKKLMPASEGTIEKQKEVLEKMKTTPGVTEEMRKDMEEQFERENRARAEQEAHGLAEKTKEKLRKGVASK